MDSRSAISGVRERLVLGSIRPLLERGESVLSWAHVEVPGDGRHGLLSVTAERALVRWTPRDLADVSIRWDELTDWRVEERTGRGPVVLLESRDASLAVCLPVSSRSRARTASRVLRQVAHLARPAAAFGDEPIGPDLRLVPPRRGWRGHTKRAIVTVLGLLVIVVGVAFASPFVPGPGLLTILAGLAILAREYDWARDAHHWLKHKAERLFARLRARRRRRRARAAANDPVVAEPEIGVSEP